MTRKDYQLIAQAICDARKVVAHESGNADTINGANAGFYELARILSARFFEENPRFDDNKWMIATETLHN